MVAATVTWGRRFNKQSILLGSHGNAFSTPVNGPLHLSTHRICYTYEHLDNKVVKMCLRLAIATMC